MCRPEWGQQTELKKNGEGERYQVSCLHFWEEEVAKSLMTPADEFEQNVSSLVSEYGNAGSNSDSDSSTQF